MALYVCLFLCSGSADAELLSEVQSLMANDRFLYWSKVRICICDCTGCGKIKDPTTKLHYLKRWKNF